eukprot:4176932-Pyramimonas_sp.AAC.1
MEKIGQFSVRRHDDKLRSIADTRAANVHFCEPSCTELASSGALTAIEQCSVDLVCFNSGDVEVCFNQCELPHWLRCFFTLPAPKAQYLPASLRRRLGLVRDARLVKFRFRAVPMGWSWAA